VLCGPAKELCVDNHLLDGLWRLRCDTSDQA